MFLLFEAVYLSCRCKKVKKFSGTLLPEPPAGLHHDPVAELTAPQDPNLCFATFENSIFVQTKDITKTAWINA